MLELLAVLHDPDVEIGELQHKIALDVGLSFRLLGYIGSAFLGVRQQVRSISQAVSLLGLEQLKQWASLTVLISGDEQPAELRNTALLRARFCELATQNDLQADCDEMFTLGLFSVIDVLFETPMAELVAKLPLGPDMCEALVEHTGRQGELLECLNALEGGDHDKAEGILPSAGQLYISARAWAEEVAEPPLGSHRPVAELAEFAQRLPRSTHTRDLSASLRSGGRCLGVGSVLNVCEGGMLVELSSDLEVGEIVGFELVGPRFRCVGFAALVHREDEAIGLRFDTWEGPVDHSIRELVAVRLRRGQLGSQDPGEAANGLPTVRNSRTGGVRKPVYFPGGDAEQRTGPKVRLNT
ncbi:MAG: EAL and HDOD domain-containing protein [Solirubrobacteraceae bacterium]